MPKILLALVLLTAQSLSWGGVSLYLCLEADGSCCIDTGPSTCHCSHGGDSHEHDGIATHAAPAAKPQALSDAGCGCMHLLLLSQQPTVVVTRPLTHDIAGLGFVAVPVGDRLPVPQLAEIISLASAEVPMPFAALNQRASVVLRC
jgi:hypothetical protein